jgi:hypothetical protein
MYPLLGDHSRQGLEKVDPRFIGTHARLCDGVQFLDISKATSPQTRRQLLAFRTSSAPRHLSSALLKPLTGFLSLVSGAFLTA